MSRKTTRICPNLYRERIRGYFCVYCGEVSTTDDHFPPYSTSTRGFLLPACSECNSLAGNRYPRDFELRALAVKQKLKERYAHELSTPDWSKEEINELGRGLKKGTNQWQKQVSTARQRIAWNAISYLSSASKLSGFALSDVVNDSIQESEERYSRRLKPADKPLSIDDMIAKYFDKLIEGHENQ